MLERVRTELDHETGIASTPHYELTVSDVISFLRTYWPTIVASALACLTLGVIYVLTAKPTYTAVAQILIEANQQTTPTLANTQTLMAMDTPQVESEIALLESEQIARKVAQLLEQRGQADAGPPRPSKEADVGSATPSYLTWFYRLLFGTPKPETDDEKEARLKALMAQIQGGMDIRRVGQSYVLNVGSRSRDPKMAANVANAIGDAYVQDKLDVRAQSARQGGTWLEARIEELRRSMNDAALDVQVFKAKRDYRLYDKPNDEGRPRDDLPAFGPNPEIGSGAATPPAPQPDAKKLDDKAGEASPEHTTLDELESRAETYKKIYESYLQAYMETVQRQSYPGTNARVITRADPPQYKSAPKRLLILAGSLVLGTILGLGLSLVRFSFDKTVRSPRQIERNLEVPLLGEVTHANFLNGSALSNLVPRRLRPNRKRQLASSFFIVENKRSPHSARELSATAVALKKAMDVHGAHVVGFLGTTPDLNSAAVSSNLALLNAHAGWRTLLIETDAGSPNLKSFFASGAAYSLQDLLTGSVAAASVVATWPNLPKLSLLLAKSSNIDWSSDQISHLKTLIDQAANEYDVILVHLPHANSANRALAAIDNVVIVAKAHQTTMPELIDITASLRLSGKQPLGVVISDLV